MGRGIDIPGIGGRYTMARRSWVRGRYTMSKGVDILCVEGSIYLG